MSEARLETLFEAYRSRGDLEALGRVFDRTAPELLVLAAHLVRDAVEAEDLVQATFQAAIEGAEAYDAARRLEPWLAGILARKAARLARERARRPDPRRLERPEEPDPAQRVQQQELVERLRAGLVQLSEPYRSVLEATLRGEGPLEIAAGTGRAPGTVRMQLLRGLDRLRRRLPQGLLGVAALPRLPRGLGALRVEVLSGGALAAAPALPVSVAGPLVAPLVSGALMLKLTAALSVLVLALWFGLRSSRAEPRALGPAPAPASGLVAELEPARRSPSLPSAQRGSAAAQRLESSDDSAREAVAREPGRRKESGLWVVGRLLGLAGLDPAEAVVQAQLIGTRSVQGRADGSYEIDVTELVLGRGFAPGRAPEPILELTAGHPGHRQAAATLAVPPAALELGAQERLELRLDLELVPWTVVVGRVELDAAVPAALSEGEVRVALYPASVATAGAEGASPICIAEATPSFELSPSLSGELLLVAFAPGLPPLSRLVQVPAGEVTDVGTLRLEPGGATLEGWLVLAFAAELSSYELLALPAGSDWQRDPLRCLRFEPAAGSAGARVVAGAQRGSVSPEGHFAIGGLEPGEHDLYLLASRELVKLEPLERVRAPRAGLRVGQDLGRLRLSVEAVGTPALLRPQVRVEGPRGDLAHGLEPGGVQVLIADRRSPLVLVAEAPGWEPLRHESPAGARGADEELVLRLQPEEHMARLEVRSFEDVLSATRLQARLLGEGRILFGERSRDGWLFRLEPGPHSLLLEPPRAFRQDASGRVLPSHEPALRAGPLQVDLAPGATQVCEVEWSPGTRVRFVPAPESSWGSLRARVLDAAGSVLDVTFERLEAGAGSFTISCSADTLACAPVDLQPLLAPGRYQLVLEREGLELTRIAFETAEAGLLEVPVRLP